MTNFNLSPKILYFGTPDGAEYMSDCTFHGLRELLGENVVDARPIRYMYKQRTKQEQDGLLSLYGNGFTLAGRLPELNIDRTDIINKIKLKYFDYIIFGAAYRNDCVYSDSIETVLSHYEPKKIIFISGDDASYPGQQNPPSYNGIHFLRERYDDDNTIPISFSTPKENIVKEIPEKTINLMPLIPGVPWNEETKKTYIYKTEEEYYNAYKQSLFGLTWKKGGWDCLRHYEILSQGCIPLFLDIVHLPKTMMIHFPRHELEKVLDVAVKIERYNKTMDFVYDKYTIQNIDFQNIHFNNIDSYGYYEIANNLLTHTKTYLTTEYTAKYILDNINKLQ